MAKSPLELSKQIERQSTNGGYLDPNEYLDEDGEFYHAYTPVPDSLRYKQPKDIEDKAYNIIKKLKLKNPVDRRSITFDDNHILVDYLTDQDDFRSIMWELEDNLY